MHSTVSDAALVQPTPPEPGFVAAFAANRLEGISGPTAHLERIAAVDNLLALIVESAAVADHRDQGGDLAALRREAAMRSALYLMGEAVRQSTDPEATLAELRVAVEMIGGAR